MGTQYKKPRFKRKPYKNKRGNTFRMTGFSKFGKRGFSLAPVLPEGATGITGVSQFFRNLVRGNR